MIGRLQGILLQKQPPLLLINVGGVGYEVEAPMSTFYYLPDVNQEVVLHTHFVVREDAQALYGFYSEAERKLFRYLIKISGVGPKLALTLLSGISADDFVRCVMQEDASSLTRLPGVGKKTAERLLVEMRDKVKDWQLADTPAARQAITANKASDEAVTALIALGYKPAEASKLISRVSQVDMTVEQIIKAALSDAIA